MAEQKLHIARRNGVVLCHLRNVQQHHKKSEHFHSLFFLKSTHPKMKGGRRAIGTQRNVGCEVFLLY